MVDEKLEGDYHKYHSIIAPTTPVASDTTNKTTGRQDVLRQTSKPQGPQTRPTTLNKNYNKATKLPTKKIIADPQLGLLQKLLASREGS